MPRKLPEQAAAKVPPSTTIRVVVVDHQMLVLQALARAFQATPDIDVVGTAVSLRDLDSLFRAHLGPHVVVMDLALPDGSGIDGCRLVRARWPRTRILILSAGSGRPQDVRAAVEAGADGYLLRSCSVETLIEAIRTAFAGELLLTPELLGDIARQLPHRPTEQVLTQPLTPRQLTVLRLLSFGHSTRAIANELDLSQGTVRVHVEAIRRKFRASTRLEAVSAAIQHHIVAVPAA